MGDLMITCTDMFIQFLSGMAHYSGAKVFGAIESIYVRTDADKVKNDSGGFAVTKPAANN